MKPGLYLHIPFCEQRCYYCAFTVAVSPENAFEPYIRRLVREIELSGFQESAASIYFGGGTPSIVAAELIGRVLGSFRSLPAEVSIEVNPGTLSEKKIQRYRDLGITRISLGAQSLEDEDLERPAVCTRRVQSSQTCDAAESRIHEHQCGSDCGSSRSADANVEAESRSCPRSEAGAHFHLHAGTGRAQRVGQASAGRAGRWRLRRFLHAGGVPARSLRLFSL